MSDQNLDYEAIRQIVDKNLPRHKWLYRGAFLAMHVLFFIIAMLSVWGTLAADSQLWDILFNADSDAAVIVTLPTILWLFVLFFHIASLYFESDAGEKVIRERLLLREVGEDMLKQIIRDEELTEKPKRRGAALELRHRLSSDDGELILLEDDQDSDQDDYYVRPNRADSP